MHELVELRDRLQRLAEWHEQQRDAALVAGGGTGHTKAAVEHNRAAADCYNAAITINEYIRYMES
jgi:hypothetical protein